MEEPAAVPGEAALLAEAALAVAWLRPEEDVAWSRLYMDGVAAER